MNNQVSASEAIKKTPVEAKFDMFAFPTKPRSDEDVRRAWLVFGNLVSLDIIEIDFADKDWSARVRIAIEGIAQAICSSST